jgi:hypothetical protein
MYQFLIGMTIGFAAVGLSACDDDDAFGSSTSSFSIGNDG